MSPLKRYPGGKLTCSGLHWQHNLHFLRLLTDLLLIEVWLVGGIALEWHIGWSIRLLSLWPLDCRGFGPKIGFIFAVAIKWQVTVIILDPWLEFLSHAGWVSRVVFPVGWVNIVVVSVCWGTRILRLCPDRNGMLVIVVTVCRCSLKGNA